MRAGREAVPQAVAVMWLSMLARSSRVCLSRGVEGSRDGGPTEEVENWERASQYWLRVR